jgi:lysophospholipid acyltransferase (LPLAT)-like uncharacterized protein
MSARIRMAASCAAYFIKLLGRTWRIRTIDDHFIDEARKVSGAVVFCFWHGRFLPLSYTHRNLSAHVLASSHRDGELMGQTIRKLGFGHVRGSSTRGGAKAIRDLVMKLEEGFDLGITVDGPRGPKYVAKPGPIEVAKLSGAPIVPVTTGSRKRWVFSSWDAFELPKPFTSVAVRYGKPLVVPAGADGETVEAMRSRLEAELRSITEINDAAITA